MHSENIAPAEAATSVPDKGLHLVSAEHRRRWEQGGLSLREIADEVGVRKQSVHALAKKQGWRRSSAESMPPKPSPAAAQPAIAERIPNNGQAQQASTTTTKGVDKDPTTIEMPRVVDQLAASTAARDLSDLQIRTRQAFIQLHLYMVQEATAYLVRERGKHGPQALRAIAAIIARSQNQLAALGVVGADAAAELPATLEVRVYTPEEEAGIRRQVEQDAAVLRAQRATEPVPHENAAATAGPQKGEGATEPIEAPLAIICEPLPDASGFRDWLVMLGHRYGARHLRDISTALGGKNHRDRDALVEEILTVTNCDPERLRPLSKSVQ